MGHDENYEAALIVRQQRTTIEHHPGTHVLKIQAYDGLWPGRDDVLNPRSLAGQISATGLHNSRPRSAGQYAVI